MFFMVASKFNEMERNIEVQVPQVAEAGDGSCAAAAACCECLRRWADRSGRPGGYDCRAHFATGDLSLAGWRPTVVVRGDASCPFQHVASALGACRAANISDLGITVRTADAGRADHSAVSRSLTSAEPHGRPT